MRWRSALPEVKPQGREAKTSVATWLKGAAQEIVRITKVIDECVGEALFSDPSFRGGKMPHGTTFAAPVRGGYNTPKGTANGAGDGRRGGRPRPPTDRPKCIDVLREIIEDLADGKHKVDDYSELNRLHDEITKVGRKVFGVALLEGGGNDVYHMGLLDDAERIMSEIKKIERDEEAIRDQRDKEGWRQWLEQDFSRGASNAHKATQVDEEEQPTTVTSSKGVISASPMDFLRSMRAKYAALWNAPETPLEYEWSGPVAELPRLTAAQLRTASASFCKKKRHGL